MSMRYDGAVRRRHLLTNVHSLNRIRCRTRSQKPMEIVAHGAGDVVELPPACDKSSLGMITIKIFLNS